jgi:tRNA (cmo5U34)-methyltransferase
VKSTVEEIRERFDGDVERFSNLETGQSATVDAPLILELVSEAAALATPNALAMVDVGCGAGNYTLKMLQRLPNLDCTLIDLSMPMLLRARERVQAATQGRVETIQSDIRDIQLSERSADIVVAAMVLHHLRSDDEWLDVAERLFRCLRPGGSLWIADMVDHVSEPVRNLMVRRYGEYLKNYQGESYRDNVLRYIEREDSPRPLGVQLRCLETVGFRSVDILHKNSVFAAYGAIK